MTIKRVIKSGRVRCDTIVYLGAYNKFVALNNVINTFGYPYICFPIIIGKIRLQSSLKSAWVQAVQYFSSIFLNIIKNYVN